MRLDGLEMLDGRALLSTAGAIVQYGDNSLPGFSTSGGQWVALTGAGYLGNEIVLNSANGAGEATWTFDVSPGTYVVAATWPAASNQATNDTSAGSPRRRCLSFYGPTAASPG